MRALVQRVSRACVRFPEGVRAGPADTNADEAEPALEPRTIGRGVVVLLGIGSGDDEETAHALAQKCAYLRIFSNEAGRFDHSLLDIGGDALVVSQFTLYGDCRKGRRPDFTAAMPPEDAEPLYRAFVTALGRFGIPVQTGEFGARMEVELVNDGPVTLWLSLPS